MKKKVLASLLCASMVATMFAGCGSDNGGNGTEKADKKDGGKEEYPRLWPNLPQRAVVKAPANPPLLIINPETSSTLPLSCQ